MTRVVVACLGDEASLDIMKEWSPRAEVIAVAFDLGGAIPLPELRDLALASGAVRCHALDVREEFVRDALLPALRSRTFQTPEAARSAMARQFVARKLRELAELEGAAVVGIEAVAAPPPPAPPRVAAPARLQIGFAQGMPVSVNGVEMSLTELMDSVETISGESALAVLDRAYADTTL